MSEIEVKILDIDVEVIRKKLIGLGGVLVKKEQQVNYMYDFPDNTLHNNFKGFCRVREVYNLIDNSKKYILGIKKIISQIECKEMTEHETEVVNLEAAKSILIELGLINTFIHKKTRESYQINHVLYEIDEWDKNIYPRPYLEVEAKDKDSLIKGIELIGYTINDTTSKTLAELKGEL